MTSTRGKSSWSREKAMLTKAQKRQYVRQGGARCPYCGSEEILAGTIRSDFVITVDVDCQACHREWQERYDLAALYELDDRASRFLTIERGRNVIFDNEPPEVKGGPARARRQRAAPRLGSRIRCARVNASREGDLRATRK